MKGTVKEIQADFFTNTAEMIVHGCNDLGVMGAGIAVPIKKKYPDNFSAYAATCSAGAGVSLGQVVFTKTDDGLVIANAITQSLYKLTEDGLPLSYAAIESCMKTVREHCESTGIKTVAMPRIGAGLGGGDWERIHEIIEEAFADSDVDVTIYYL